MEWEVTYWIILEFVWHKQVHWEVVKADSAAEAIGIIRKKFGLFGWIKIKGIKQINSGERRKNGKDL